MDGVILYCIMSPMGINVNVMCLISYVCIVGVKSLAEELGTGEPTLQLIVDGLQQPIGHDIREGNTILHNIPLCPLLFDTNELLFYTFF